jgi:threonine aldolase
LTHTKRGDEIIVGKGSHIVWHEVGAAAVISGVQIQTITNDGGVFDLDELKALIRGENIHYPDTGLICTENANGNGSVIPLQHMKDVYALAQEHGIPLHLDGARVFNAAVALGKDVKELTAQCDSVNVCLSKGLVAPVGSIVAGTQQFIDHARKMRKLMGGGMRQAGIIAAAGIISMTDMVDRLPEDHITAEYLTQCLKEFEGIKIDESRRDINMVFFKADESYMDPETILEGLLERGIKINGPEGGEWRLVTSIDVNREGVDRLIIALKELLEK